MSGPLSWIFLPFEKAKTQRSLQRKRNEPYRETKKPKTKERMVAEEGLRDFQKQHHKNRSFYFKQYLLGHDQPVILATGEADIMRLSVADWPGQQVLETPILTSG
jgi:hypothetical protein